MWPWNLMHNLEKNRAPALCIISKLWVNSNWSYSPEALNSGLDRRFLSVRPWNLTLKTTGHLFYVASSFVHHFIAISEFKLKLQSGNAHLRSKSMFLSRVSWKCDRWPWKTTGHLFYATSSFLHHFIAICKFKLELRSRNSQIGSESTFF